MSYCIKGLGTGPVTKSSVYVRGYYYSKVNTGKARSDITEESVNCSWISTNTPKHLILFGFYDVSLKQEASTLYY